jgi:GT2 family glycosyltransferase
MDADDIWDRTKLEKQIAKFVEDPLVGLVHCGMREFDTNTGETIALHLSGAEGWVVEDLLLWEGCVAAPACSTVVRSRLFQELGGFDTRLKIAEDWDLCLRIAKTHKIGFVAQPLVDYRNHGANVTKDVGEMERSTLLAWATAFDTDDQNILRLRRRSYSYLHKVLAGSYLHAGKYRGFLRNLLKSLWFRPSYLGYYLSLLPRLGGRNNK